MAMKVLVLGGDGFCGWPVALRLSAAGMAVTIVDSLVRRRIDTELGARSLTPIASIEDRLAAWDETTGKRIGFAQIDLARDYSALSSLIARERPQAVVHFAEQRSAPYSMISPDRRRYTVENNIAATHNVLCALTEHGVDAHFVHLGSIGVYGYETVGYSIPEGYLKVRRLDGSPGSDRPEEILHPFNPVSVYHLTKAMDHLLIAFYAHQHGIRATDLHQGIVWGVATAETASDPRLVNRFDYDVEFGTVLHRFAVQAALGRPLSVYGAGGQTRAFIHVGDMVRCIERALADPPAPGARVRVVNQIAESRGIGDLARQISQLAGTGILHVENPRHEPEANELDVTSDGVRRMGIAPARIDARLIGEITDIAMRHSDRIDPEKLYPGRGIPPALSGSAAE